MTLLSDLTRATATFQARTLETIFTEGRDMRHKLDGNAIASIRALPAQEPPIHFVTGMRVVEVCPQPGKEVMPDGSDRAAVEASPGVTAGATGKDSDADFLRDAGIDGVKWAAGFKAVAERLGHHGMDEGWLIGWFCNAIMAGYDEAERRSAKAATPAPVVPAEGLDALVKRAYRAANSCLTNDDAIIRELAGAITALRTAPPVGARVSIPPGLIDALRSQRQIDADGCEVAVSRQACDEAAAILAALLPAGEVE